MSTPKVTGALTGSLGSSYLNAGYVYAPYVPLIVSPTIVGVQPPVEWQNSSDMFIGEKRIHEGEWGEWSSRSLRKKQPQIDFYSTGSIMSRYGKKMVRSDFYGVVNVMDLPDLP